MLKRKGCVHVKQFLSRTMYLLSCPPVYSEPVSLLTFKPQWGQQHHAPARPPQRGFYKAIKAQLPDPEKVLQNIVAMRSKGWLRTMGWNEGFSPFQWGQSSAAARVAEEAAAKGQMAPPELQSPGARVADDYEPERLRRALQEGTLSFGYSAGGLVFPFFIGVLYELQDLGIVTPQTKLAGASAGSIIATCFHSGLSRTQVIDSCLHLAHDCRTNGTRHRIGLVLRDVLHEALPEDSHRRCADKAYIAVTQAFPRPRGVLVSQFQDKADLIDTVLTSCHVPWWLDGRLMTQYRGRFHYDGGLSNFIPLAPFTEGVRVCCFPAGQLATFSNIAIAPDAYCDWPHDLNQMLQWAFEPAEPETLMYLIDHGAKQARCWAEAHGLLDVTSSQDQQRVASQPITDAAWS